MKNMHTYYHYLSLFHKLLCPKTYVEIGIRKGASLRLADPNITCIGIDPDHDIQFPISHKTEIYSLTSDDFFSKYNLTNELGQRPVDLAFIDGMHLFEFALRDFINLEKHCTKDSTIVIHDCWPVDIQTSSRERSTEFWTGDVWKLIPFLNRYRPDLDICTWTVEPSGLGFIRGLDPNSTTLSLSYEKLIEEYVSLDYSWLGNDKKDKLNWAPCSPTAIQNFFSVDLSRAREFYKKTAFESSPKLSLENLFKQKIISTPKFKSLARLVGIKPKPKMLGVLLCYNDADILGDAIKYLLNNNHDLIVWDHGSDDSTPEILEKYRKELFELRLVPRSVDFYGLYSLMSKHLMDNYISDYDWISWPDQDEFLEGPTREKSYYESIADIFDSPSNWIQFNNCNFWFTREDDMGIKSPVKRIRRYSPWIDCSPRVRSWRASVTNIRKFNHNALAGEKHGVNFNLRHYPMRSKAQAIRRLQYDRADLRRGNANYHYDKMKQSPDTLLVIPPEKLYLDDGVSDLNLTVSFNWRRIYGELPKPLPQNSTG